MSQPEDPLEAEWSALEAALVALTPSPSRIDRDHLMFRAGQAGLRDPEYRRWLWPAIAASLAFVAVSEAVWLGLRPEPRVIERLVVVREVGPSMEATEVRPRTSAPEPRRDSPEQEPNPQSPETDWSAELRYAQLRRQMLKFGVESLPEPPPLALKSAPPAPSPSGHLLRSEIDRLLNPGDPS